MPPNQYDIIVVGAGSAGLSISLFTGKAGLRTLLIDKTEQNIGGDCLNTGCVPSKALIHVSRLLYSARQATRFGLSVSGRPDIRKVLEQVHRAQSEIRKHENSEYLATQGIDVVLGEASFVDRKSVRVRDKVYSARRIVIATGSRPAHPAISGIEMVRAFDNESIFDITDLPSRMLIIGAGPVGVEMAQVFSRLACDVTLVGRNKKILPADPKEITDPLEQQFLKEGITIYTGSQIDRFTSPSTCILKDAQGKERELSFDAIFLATGRSFQLDALNLNLADVRVERGKIKNDLRLATTNPRIFVCGDVAGRHMFSHAAEHHARVLLNNFFSPLKHEVDDRKGSWVTFSDPQVATFGMSEGNLKQLGRRYEKLVHDFNQDDRAVVDEYQYGKLVLLVTPKNLWGQQRILGGSMIAPHAGEMIQELVTAMNTSLDIKVFFDKIYPYPVASRVNQFIVVNHQEKRLTQGIKKMLRLLFRM